MQPDPKRLRKILSTIISFIKFKQEKTDLLDSHLKTEVNIIIF